LIRTLEEARKAMEEREDDVKVMNTIMTYSKCVTERDGQKMDRVSLLQINAMISTKMMCIDSIFKTLIG
jgi:hypothetical protein